MGMQEGRGHVRRHHLQASREANSPFAHGRKKREEKRGMETGDPFSSQQKKNAEKKIAQAVFESNGVEGGGALLAGRKEVNSKQTVNNVAQKKPGSTGKNKNPLLRELQEKAGYCMVTMGVGGEGAASLGETGGVRVTRKGLAQKFKHKWMKQIQDYNPRDSNRAPIPPTTHEQKRLSEGGGQGRGERWDPGEKRGIGRLRNKEESGFLVEE